MLTASDIIRFWFEEIDESRWWKKDNAFDEEIRQRFTEVHRQANRGELFAWRTEPSGRLAEIIILDQFSRNIFREKPQAFASDALALILAQEAIAANMDQDLSVKQKMFLYMPFMHSESLLIHEHAVELFSALGVESTLEFELKHKVIIDQFGRYPHRNHILDRVSTSEELEFLKQPGSSF